MDLDTVSSSRAWSASSQAMSASSRSSTAPATVPRTYAETIRGSKDDNRFKVPVEPKKQPSPRRRPPKHSSGNVKGSSHHRRERSPSPDHRGDDGRRKRKDDRDVQSDSSHGFGRGDRSDRSSHRSDRHSDHRSEGHGRSSDSSRPSAGSPLRHRHSEDPKTPSPQMTSASAEGEDAEVI